MKVASLTSPRVARIAAGATDSAEMQLGSRLVVAGGVYGLVTTKVSDEEPVPLGEVAVTTNVCEPTSRLDKVAA